LVRNANIANGVGVDGVGLAALVDDSTLAPRLLVDRRDGLGRARTGAVSRLHHLLLELVPGVAKQFLDLAGYGSPPASQAAAVPPPDLIA
jgi:hypothetical protein